MKILIISMTCGEGHNQASNALKKVIENGGSQCEVMQLYGYNKKTIEKKNRTFLNACKFFPHIYNSIWLNACKNPPEFYINGVIKNAKSMF